MRRDIQYARDFLLYSFGGGDAPASEVSRQYCPSSISKIPDPRLPSLGDFTGHIYIRHAFEYANRMTRIYARTHIPRLCGDRDVGADPTMVAWPRGRSFGPIPPSPPQRFFAAFRQPFQYSSQLIVCSCLGNLEDDTIGTGYVAFGFKAAKEAFLFYFFPASPHTLLANVNRVSYASSHSLCYPP
jgi:hypothetical protein